MSEHCFGIKPKRLGGDGKYTTLILVVLYWI